MSKPFSPKTLFFYGTLIIPERLNRVLDRPPNHQPVLKDASISGWRMKMWGPYPVLIPAEEYGEGDVVITGKAYEVESAQDLVKLHYYEGHNYEVKDCDIKIASDEGGGKKETIVKGGIFAWIGDVKQLKEGTFNMTEYVESQRRSFKVAF